MINPNIEYPLRQSFSEASRISKQLTQNIKNFVNKVLKHLNIFSDFEFRISDFSLRGFTLPELIVTVTIFASLLIFVTISVVNVKQRASLNTSVDILISDMKQQQLKAMVGDTEGRGTRDEYGIHFSTNDYTLFHGTTFNAADASNFTVNFGDNVSLVSGADIVFSRRSGELAGGATVSVVVTEKTTNEQRTIQINKYGVITGVN